MTEKIVLQRDLQEYYFKEGCFILETHNSPDDPEVSIARVRVLPGETTQWHRLAKTAERYYVLSGQGSIEIGELPATDLSAGDLAWIPANCRQRITNTGDVDLVFLAICSPRFHETAYVDCEGLD